MSKIIIEIETDNEAFTFEGEPDESTKREETIKILKQAIKNIQNKGWIHDFALYDTNGNKVGTLKEEKIILQKEERKRRNTQRMKED